MGQSQANEWIHSLLPILKQALDDLGFAPERDPQKCKTKEKERKEVANSIIDGTERRCQRPKQAEKQALHYSAKKKIHSDKNVVIVTAKKKRVSYLSQTGALKGCRWILTSGAKAACSVPESPADWRTRVGF